MYLHYDRVGCCRLDAPYTAVTIIINQLRFWTTEFEKLLVGRGGLPRISLTITASLYWHIDNKEGYSAHNSSCTTFVSYYWTDRQGPLENFLGGTKSIWCPWDLQNYFEINKNEANFMCIKLQQEVLVYWS